MATALTDHPDDHVSVLGTGAIGTAVARALLASGRQVRVWNRTRSRTALALAAGAEPAATAEEAVAASPLTLVCLTDQTAAASVLSSLPRPDGPGPRRTVVLLTTGTPDEAAAMHQLLQDRSLHHLDAGVQTAPEDVGSRRARFFLAGEREDFDRHRQTLELLGETRWVGADPRAAAVWDLALFGLWYDAQLGLLRGLELTQAASVDPDGFVDAAVAQLGHVVAGAAATADEVATGVYPAGPASLAEHLPLLGQLIESRRRARTGDGGLVTAERLVADLVSGGAGELGLTAVLTGPGTGPGVSAG
jgi:3-hydroxyisobutyrate dehydrogenase-like beta-hydroxyacid dehydrogenase